MRNKGKISQVIGPVVDVEFEKDLPEIYSALEVKLEENNKLVLETHQHLGGSKVRAVAMGRKPSGGCSIFWASRLTECRP